MAGRRGITLFENVTAVVLLGILVSGTIFSFASAKMWANAARHHYEAVNIARAGLEYILAGGAAGDLDSTPTIDPGTGLTGTLAVANPTAETIDVTVSWTEPMWTSATRSETIVMRLP